jgi:hypothetical protein
MENSSVYAGKRSVAWAGVQEWADVSWGRIAQLLKLKMSSGEGQLGSGEVNRSRGQRENWLVVGGESERRGRGRSKELRG